MSNYTITAWARFRGSNIKSAYRVEARDLPDAFRQVFFFMATGFYADDARHRFVIPERILISDWQQ